MTSVNNEASRRAQGPDRALLEHDEPIRPQAVLGRRTRPASMTPQGHAPSKGRGDAILREV